MCILFLLPFLTVDGTSQGSILYYFKSRNNVKRLHGVIPLERARITPEPPAGFLRGGSGAQLQHALCITITLHVSHAYIARHPWYVLLAPTPEVHAAWCAALLQASIPRGALLNKLQATGAMDDVVAESAEQTQLCFPTAGGAVISSAACIRLDPLGTAPAAPAMPMSDVTAVVVATTPTAGCPGPGKATSIAQSRPLTASTVHASPGASPAPHRVSVQQTPRAPARASAQHAQHDVGLRTTYGGRGASVEIEAAA
jgi:hypothetical protein